MRGVDMGQFHIILWSCSLSSGANLTSEDHCITNTLTPNPANVDVVLLRRWSHFKNYFAYRHATVQLHCLSLVNTPSYEVDVMQLWTKSHPSCTSVPPHRHVLALILCPQILASGVAFLSKMLISKHSNSIHPLNTNTSSVFPLKFFPLLPIISSLLCFFSSHYSSTPCPSQS